MTTPSQLCSVGNTQPWGKSRKLPHSYPNPFSKVSGCFGIGHSVHSCPLGHSSSSNRADRSPGFLQGGLVKVSFFALPASAPQPIFLLSTSAPDFDHDLSPSYPSPSKIIITTVKCWDWGASKWTLGWTSPSPSPSSNESPRFWKLPVIPQHLDSNIRSGSYKMITGSVST